LPGKALEHAEAAEEGLEKKILAKEKIQKKKVGPVVQNWKGGGIQRGLEGAKSASHLPRRREEKGFHCSI